MAKQIYKSERLYLKLLTESDIDECYVHFFKNEKLLRFYSGSGKIFDRQSLLSELNNYQNNNPQYIYGIFTHKKQLIGNIKIGPILLNHNISDLIIYIGDVQFHGKGYAEEALEMGKKIAFEIYGIRKLTGGAYALNMGSVLAYCNAGWVIEGSLKGHYLVNNRPVDRILFSCFNPDFFPEKK